MAAAKTTKKKTVTEVNEAASASAEVKEEVKAAKKPAKTKSAQAASSETDVPAAKPAKTETSEKKTTVKKTTTTKKAAAKKVAPETKVFIEYYGSQFAAKAILDRAVEAYKSSHTDEIKTVEVYIKPEENAAYYVVNGEGSDDFRIEL